MSRRSRRLRGGRKAAKSSAPPLGFDVQAAFTEALGHQRAGRLGEAEAAYRRLLSAIPESSAVHANLAVVLRRLGNFQGAIDSCKKAIVLDPDIAAVHATLGAAETDRGQPARGVAALLKALSLEPDLLAAHINIAAAYKDMGRLGEARKHAARAVELAPEIAEAHNTLATVAQAEGDRDAARAGYMRAIELDPANVESLTNLGAILAKDDEAFDEAIALYDRAIVADPNYKHAHNNRGSALSEIDDRAGAKAAYGKALEIDPGFAGAHNNMASALSYEGQFEKALDHYARAVEINPEYVEAHSNMAGALRDMGRPFEAIETARHAIELDPDFPDAHLDLALSLLLTGQFNEGWKENEWRWRTGQLAKAQREFPQPLWDGTGRPTETLLLHAEQGLGDTLQFIRYVPLLAPRVGRLVVECPVSILPLVEGLAGVDQWVASGEPLPDFDLHLPLMSAPLVLQTELASIPANVPYVDAPPPQAVKGDGFKVGLVWAGNPDQLNDRNRSTSLETLAPLLDIPGCSFHSLQFGAAGDEIEALGLSQRITDQRPHIIGFGPTAAVMKGLDLIITVDTSAAHLAGAMGLPVWTLLCFAPDWRWLLDREDTPWYPTMRLFRQPALQDWASVVDRVATELEAAVTAD